MFSSWSQGLINKKLYFRILTLRKIHIVQDVLVVFSKKKKSVPSFCLAKGYALSRANPLSTIKSVHVPAKVNKKITFVLKMACRDVN